MSRETHQEESADLVRIDPARKQHRYYHCAVWPGLFGDVSLVREWGRIGQPGQQRLDALPDTDVAVGKMTELVRRKQRRGYQRIA